MSAGSARCLPPGYAPKARAWEFFALDHERDQYQGVSIDFGSVSRGAVYILFRDDGSELFVVLFIYPETKGITLEQMQRRLGIDREAQKSLANECLAVRRKSSL